MHALCCFMWGVSRTVTYPELYQGQGASLTVLFLSLTPHFVCEEFVLYDPGSFKWEVLSYMPSAFLCRELPHYMPHALL